MKTETNPSPNKYFSVVSILTSEPGTPGSIPRRRDNEDSQRYVTESIWLVEKRKLQLAQKKNLKYLGALGEIFNSLQMSIIAETARTKLSKPDAEVTRDTDKRINDTLVVQANTSEIQKPIHWDFLPKANPGVDA